MIVYQAHVLTMALVMICMQILNVGALVHMVENNVKLVRFKMNSKIWFKI